MGINIKCTGADLLPLDVIIEFQGGLKKTTPANLKKLIDNILLNGFIAPIFVWDDKGDHKIMDGHSRLKALVELRQQGYDIPLIPVDYIKAKDEKEARRMLLSITSQYGEFDIEELQSWVNELDEDLKETLRIVDEEVRLATEPEEVTVNDDEINKDVKPIIKSGDLIELGRHRLLCGDSTKIEDVEKLMDGEKADMVFTDPPYGVSYADKNEFLNNHDKGNRIQKEIKNDHLDIDDCSKLWFEAFKAFIPILSDYSSYYICSPQGGDLFSMMMMMIKESGLQLKHQIIWVKNNHVLGRCDYNYKHEPIFYGWYKKHKYYGKGAQRFSVWNYDKPVKNDIHPTMKPVDLIINAVMNSSENNQIIIDPFLGSGSTLIACEKTNRKCYGMELDEHYCDVIMNRYIKWCADNNKEYSVKINGVTIDTT